MSDKKIQPEISSEIIPGILPDHLVQRIVESEDGLDDIPAGLSGFEDNVLEGLPDILDRCTKAAKESHHKKLILFSAIVVLSGAMPGVKLLYDGRWIGANLYGYCLGEAASGKGLMDIARFLVFHINQALKERYAQALEDYRVELRDYKIQMKLLKEAAEAAGTELSPQKPPKPVNAGRVLG